MNMPNFIVGWFYYSFYYMLLSVFATVMLNKATRKLWLSPLIVNAVSIVLLILLIKNNLITESNASYAMYFNYMPIVFSSVMVNLIIGLKNVIEKHWLGKVQFSKVV